MHTRSLALVLALALAGTSCSSGLGEQNACTSAPSGSKSGNVSTGLFFGFPLRSDAPGGGPASIDDQAAAGGFIPGVGDVVFYAFETDAAADDAGESGASRFLDRNGVADTNQANDIFVAAVVKERIDQSAFSYSLAGKFRHARCASCHSVSKEPGIAAAPLTTVFDLSGHPGNAPQLGSGEFQETDENSCVDCHGDVLDSVGGQGSPLNVGWRNPPTELDADFRLLSTAELADRARNASDDHFARDRRVTWAVEGGLLPSGGGGSVATDDDHDGIAEDFDTDGRRRTVPGSRSDFLGEIDAFLCGGPTDTRAAMTDVVLVSRRSTLDQSPDSACNEPDIAFVSNPDFPATSSVAGDLYIVYSSEASDIVTPAPPIGVRQIYRVAIRVSPRADGGIDLAYTGHELVSQSSGVVGDGDSSAPTINSEESSPGSGNAGQRVAFVTVAGNLGTGVGQAVLVTDLSIDPAPVLFASSPLGQCSEPNLDSTGTALAFVSLQQADGDGDNVEDVYFTELGGVALTLDAGPERASLGENAVDCISDQPDVIRSGGRVLVAFRSACDLDDDVLAGANATEVFLYDHATSDVSQVSASLGITGEVVLPDGPSCNPVFPGRGDRLVYETLAANLDTAFLFPPDPDFGNFSFASGDENGGADLMLASLDGVLSQAGQVRTTALSVSPAGAFGDRSTGAPVAGSFGADRSYFVGGLTLARNLGAADNHDGALQPLEATSWLSFVQDQRTPTPFAEVSLALRANCSSCHDPGEDDAGNFNMGFNDDDLIATLLGDTPSCGGSYIVPNDLPNSVLFQFLVNNGCTDPVMPPSGMQPATIAVVRDWIELGAPTE